MHNTQPCGSFLESCFWVDKHSRRVAWLCMKTKRSGWGLVGTRLHVWLHSTDTDVVWQLPPPSRHQEAGRKIYKLGWGGAWGQTQDVLQQSQSTMISTGSGEQAQDKQQACCRDRCSLSLKLCLAVCTLSCTETTRMNMLQMLVNHWETSTTQQDCACFKTECHSNCKQTLTQTKAGDTIHLGQHNSTF